MWQVFRDINLPRERLHVALTGVPRDRPLERWFAAYCFHLFGYRHQKMRPSRSQKCDRQPVRRQTDGEIEGRPLASTLSRQRCSASGNRASSIASPQPHGHVMPTLQASPSSCVTTTVRMGSRSGRMSALSHWVSQCGSLRFAAFRHSWRNRARSVDHQRQPVMATVREPECSEAVLGRRGPVA